MESIVEYSARRPLPLSPCTCAGSAELWPVGPGLAWGDDARSARSTDGRPISFGGPAALGRGRGGESWRVCRSVALKKGASSKRRVPQSTAEYRRVPQSTAGYRRVPQQARSLPARRCMPRRTVRMNAAARTARSRGADAGRAPTARPRAPCPARADAGRFTLGCFPGAAFWAWPSAELRTAHMAAVSTEAHAGALSRYPSRRGIPLSAVGRMVWSRIRGVLTQGSGRGSAAEAAQSGLALRAPARQESPAWPFRLLAATAAQRSAAQCTQQPHARKLERTPAREHTRAASALVHRRWSRTSELGASSSGGWWNVGARRWAGLLTSPCESRAVRQQR
jgi:hypothetical protein